MNQDMNTPAGLWLNRLILAAVFFALIRYILPPNSFSGTVLIFDYEFGLMRRGLLGEIANFYWGNSVSKHEVFVVAAAMNLFGVFCLYLVFSRLLSQTTATGLLQLVFFTSIAFAACVASTGYLDLLLISLVCLALLSSPETTFGLVARTAVCIIGPFFHEIMLPYFAVYLVFDIWVGCKRMPAVPRVISALLPLLACSIVFVALALWGQLPAENLPLFLEYIDRKAEFTPDPHATVVMERSILDNFAVMQEMYATQRYWSWVILDGLPLLAMSAWVFWLGLKILGSDAGSLTKLLLAGAITAPLSLNIIAFDVVRFGAISVVVGFLSCLSMIRSDPTAPERLAKILTWPVVVILIVLNLNFGVNQLNISDGHKAMLPWGLVNHVNWLR